MAGVIRVDVEWARGRLFDRDVAQLFQQIVTEARALRCVDVSVKEERRQRPNGRPLEFVNASLRMFSMPSFMYQHCRVSNETGNATLFCKQTFLGRPQAT